MNAKQNNLAIIKADILRRRALVNCPSCENRIAYRMNHVVHGVVEVNRLAESINQKVPVYEDRPMQDERRGKISEAILCPCCDEYFQIEFEINVLGVRKLSADELEARAAKDAARKKVPDEWAQAVEAFGADKLLDAFTRTLEERGVGQPPNNPRQYVATFLRSALPMQLLSHQIDILEEWGDGDIEVYHFQSLAMVVIDGEIRGFVPTRYLSKRSVKQGNVIAAHAAQKQRKDFETWIRTRNGYVVSRGLMFDELKGKRPGDFAKAAGNY